MSYILEAIRRSEEARHKRLVPAVSTVHAVQPAAARGGLRTLQAGLAMGLAIAVVVGAGLALGPWLQQVQEAGPPALPLEAAPVAPDKEKPVEAPPEPAQPVVTAGAAAAPTQAEVEAPAAQAVGAGPTATAQAAVSRGEAKAEDRRPRRPYSSRAAGEPAKPRREPNAGGASGSAAGGPAQAEAAPVAQQPQTAEIVTATALRDLEPSVQRTLPSIAITLHRYASTPEARMIRVNGRVAREGEVIAGDLGVAEITRGGVVFVVGGQRFYMDAFQTWQARGGS